MGLVSSFARTVKRTVKKVVGGAKKIVKKVTKSIKKVAKKIGKTIKKIGKTIKKVGSKLVKGVKKVIKVLGPIAAMVLPFTAVFQGLWASAGIWGAMGKGALLGYLGSGGNTKAALVGALTGGVAYGVSAGVGAYNKGVNNLTTTNPNATLTEQFTAGMKSVGTSAANGVENMFLSAENALTGNTGGLNYLTKDPSTGKMVSVYQDEGRIARLSSESIYHGANKPYLESLDPKTQEYLKNNVDNFEHMTPNQITEVLESDTYKAVEGTWADAPVASNDVLGKYNPATGKYEYDTRLGDGEYWQSDSTTTYEQALKTGDANAYVTTDGQGYVNDPNVVMGDPELGSITPSEQQYVPKEFGADATQVDKLADYNAASKLEGFDANDWVSSSPEQYKAALSSGKHQATMGEINPNETVEEFNQRKKYIDANNQRINQSMQHTQYLGTGTGAKYDEMDADSPNANWDDPSVTTVDRTQMKYVDPDARPDNTKDKIAAVASSLLAPTSQAGGYQSVAAGDVGKQYIPSSGQSDWSGQAGRGVDFADSYGGAQSPTEYAAMMREGFLTRGNIGLAQ